MKLFCLVLALSLVLSCAGPIKNTSPIGKVIPTIKGVSLSGEVTEIPSVKEGQQILLIGYKQRSQFDIDRWLIGLEMTGVKIKVLEVPVLGPWFPKFLRKKIDGGMKNGIPSNLWKSVVTVYDDADLIKNFLGTTNPNNARVLLINSKSEVIAFFDNGFSAGSLREVLELIPASKRGACRDLF